MLGFSVVVDGSIIDLSFDVVIKNVVITIRVERPRSVVTNVKKSKI